MNIKSMTPKLLESETLELKEKLPNADNLAKELIAFANTKGGLLYIGITDDGVTIGRDPIQSLEEKIANIVSDCCTPRVPYVLSYETREDKTALVIEVLTGQDPPYYLTAKGLPEGVYVRIGSTCRKADKAEMARLLRRSKGIPFDRKTIDTQEIDHTLLRKYLKSRSKKLGAPLPTLSEDMLEDLGLMQDKAYTVAAELLWRGRIRLDTLLTPC